jgi:hypothetical protein
VLVICGIGGSSISLPYQAGSNASLNQKFSLERVLNPIVVFD